MVSAFEAGCAAASSAALAFDAVSARVPAVSAALWTEREALPSTAALELRSGTPTSTTVLAVASRTPSASGMVKRLPDLAVDPGERPLDGPFERVTGR